MKIILLSICLLILFIIKLNAVREMTHAVRAADGYTGTLFQSFMEMLTFHWSS